jgi:hypothetical protein
MQVDRRKIEGRQNHGSIKYHHQCSICHPNTLNHKAGDRLPSLEKRLRQPGSAIGSNHWARSSPEIENRKHTILSVGGLVIQGSVS